MKINIKNVTNIVLDGVDMPDYPDFCDAFVLSADKLDGTPLNEVELEKLNECGETISYVNENAYESLL